MSKRTSKQERERRKRAYEHERAAQASAGEKDEAPSTAAGRVARELRQDQAASGTGFRASAARFRAQLGAPRTAAQNGLIACSLVVAVWSVAFFEAGIGAIDLMGLYQHDLLMAVIRLGAMLVACGLTIRAAVDVSQLPQVVRGWAGVPLLFSFVDVVLMMVPGTSLGASAVGEVVVSVVSFGLGILMYVLCSRATAEHPEATEEWRDATELKQRQMAERARHPLKRFRKR